MFTRQQQPDHHRPAALAGWVPKIVEEVRDIAGLYVTPPEHGLVLSRAEKSQIQAFGRTQAGLPTKRAGVRP